MSDTARAALAAQMAAVIPPTAPRPAAAAPAAAWNRPAWLDDRATTHGRPAWLVTMQMAEDARRTVDAVA